MITRIFKPALPAFLFATLTAIACNGEAGPSRDLAEIRQRDTLVVLTAFNSTSYFIYRGQPMGLEYELMQQFAEEQELNLRMEVENTDARLFERLSGNEGDVVAARVIPTPRLEDEYAFTRALYATRPALVQRTGPPAAAGLPHRAESLLSWPDSARDSVATLRVKPVTSPAQLAGATVHVQQTSPYRAVLTEVSDSITGDISIVEVQGDTATESLVRQVARGEIDLAVSQENLARLSGSYFENLEVSPALGPEHPIAWGVRRGSPGLHAALNEFLARKTADGTIDALYRKYFVDRRGYRERVESIYLTSATGRLSRFDSLLRQHAQAIGWDWRLLASQAYQESRFDPAARSWAGAEGLLQLMPGTARDLGVSNSRDPSQNVAGAVKFLGQLTRQWAGEIPDSTERLKFVLASYNTGRGHVQDAQRLTAKHGGDPKKWDDVAFWLLQKSKKAVYTDPVVRYGFSRGLEPVLYVRNILERFEHYRQFVETGAG